MQPCAAKQARLTAEDVRRRLHYDPLTGIVVWAESRYSGKRAGWVETRGYRCIQVGEFTYLEHRLVWLYMKGKWPTDDIDHINGDKADNKFANLRSADDTLNLQNQRVAHANNKTGLLGVSPHGAGFRAAIQVNKRRIRLGNYATPEEAHAAYLKAKRKLHEGCTI